VRLRPQCPQRLGRRPRIVERQRGGAVIGHNPAQRGKVTLQGGAVQDRVQHHDADTREQQGGGRRQHDDDHQLLLDRHLAKRAHTIRYFFTILATLNSFELSVREPLAAAF
jgi:hypothetical protein